MNPLGLHIRILYKTGHTNKFALILRAIGSNITGKGFEDIVIESGILL